MKYRDNFTLKNIYRVFFEQDAEEDIWTEGGGSGGRLEKTA
jgi:hypothetical protein